MAESLQDRRKRLIYRSSYTGMKETDLLLGRFVTPKVQEEARLKRELDEAAYIGAAPAE